MANTLDGPRHFLIVSSSQENRAQIASAIESHIERTQFTYAADGTEAISKIQNFPPHVIVTEEELAKNSGTRVVEWAIKSLKDPAACLLLAPAPDREQFVDEIVTGHVQFVADYTDADKFSKHLSRALNFLASGGLQEFSLKFLAPGDALLRQGERAESVYILRRGQLSATVESQGQNLTLGTVEEGEFVGEMAYINGEERSADVVATRDCELIEIPIGMMDHLLFLKPSWSRALMKTLSRRIKKTNETLKKS